MYYTVLKLVKTTNKFQSDICTRLGFTPYRYIIVALHILILFINRDVDIVSLLQLIMLISKLLWNCCNLVTHLKIS